MMFKQIGRSSLLISICWMILTACGTRSVVTKPEGLGQTSLSFESRGDTFKVTVTGGYLRFNNLSENKVRYHAAPELTFSGAGQIISATDSSLTLQPALQLPAFLKQNLSVCSDGVTTYRDDVGRRVRIGRITLVYFPHADKLSALENGFYEATAEAGEPVTLAPDGRGESCQ